jgi:hypothetical protein
MAMGIHMLLANVSKGRFAEIKQQLQSWKAKRTVNL